MLCSHLVRHLCKNIYIYITIKRLYQMAVKLLFYMLVATRAMLFYEFV